MNLDVKSPEARSRNILDLIKPSSSSIVAALFVLMDQTSILVTPVFLGVVGLVFIGSAVFKAVKSRK